MKHNLNEIELKFSDENKLVYDLGGVIKFYTNQELKDNVLDILLHNSYTNRYKNTITKYFENDIIVPARYNINILSHLIYRTKIFFMGKLLGLLSDVDRLKSGLGGFYSPETKKIYLVMDNMVDINNTTNDEIIALLLLHEFSHYASSNLKNKYFSKIKKTAIKWYSKFFYYFFDLSVEKIKKEPKKYLNIIEKFYIYASENEKKGEKTFDTNEFKKYMKQQYKTLNEITYFMKNESNKNKIETLFLIITYCFLAKFNEGINLMLKNPNYLNACIKSYVDIGCEKRHAESSLFFQEFYIPSEIISIGSSVQQVADLYMKDL